MPTPGLPLQVRQFLDSLAGGIAELEVLLLLYSSSQRYWDRTEVAERLWLGPDAAAQCLEALAQRGLLDVRIAENIRYRYAPATSDQGAVVACLAAAWRDQREATVKYATSRKRMLQDFSNAFRFTKGEDADG